MKILIAEDEAISRKLLETALTEWGYEVISVGNGADAWHALQTRDAPKLAILDWMMPEMDGIDVIRRVRSIPSSEPPYIILLTSMEGSQSIVSALVAGANDYVNKPFNHDELKARIQAGKRIIELQGKLLRYNEDLEREVAERTADLLEAKDAAEAGNRTKTEFIANMSHEVRTPLNAIIGFSELLMDGIAGELNEQQKEYVKDISDSGRRLFNLIMNVLDYAEAEAGRAVLNIQKFCLKDVLNGLVLIVREELLKHKQNLSLQLEIPEDIEIEADAGKLRQALFHLLSNAVKFTPDGGRVRVRARLVASSKGQTAEKIGSSSKGQVAKEDITTVTSNKKETKEDIIESKPLTLDPWNLTLDRDFIEISVTDTGIGIKPEDMPRLFSQFTQLETPYTKKFSGTGLGLALAKKIIELHNGRISVESEFGKGSRFIVVIPVRPIF